LIEKVSEADPNCDMGTTDTWLFILIGLSS